MLAINVLTSLPVFPMNNTPCISTEWEKVNEIGTGARVA